MSHSAFYALNFIGISTVQNGTALLSAPTASGLALGDRFQIDIADPCSGLHSLLPLLMFSSFYCYFFLPKRWQQWTVFFSAIPFTIAGNVVRILLLVIGCLLWGSAFAVGTNDTPSNYHEACGFVVFVVVLGLECLFGSALVRAECFWAGSSGAAAKPSEASQSRASGGLSAFSGKFRIGGVTGSLAWRGRGAGCNFGLLHPSICRRKRAS